MNIYIAGQKHFGYLVYEAVKQMGHNIAGVCSPAFRDESIPLYVGTDQKWDRLRSAADLDGVPWLEGGRLRAETLPDDTDLIIAAHSFDFIGRRTRDKAKLGAIGYHPSLLPLHRGRDSVRWTIRMGDKVAGGTVYWLNETVDGGPIAAQDFCHVRPEWSARDLWREALQPMGVDLIRRVLGEIKTGRLVRIPQDHALASWEPSIEQPALFRPELPQIGKLPDGYFFVTQKLPAEAVK